MYTKIALAIAFSPRMEALICETKRMKDLYGASLILIHIGQDTEEKRRSLDALLDKYQVDRNKTTIIWKEGKPDRKSTRLNSSHVRISYAVFCLKKKKHS